MAEVLTVARRRELRQLAATVSSVEDAHRIIEAQDLHADPGENTSIFYYGQGVDGAKALSTREGFVRLEQTERGYFLDQVTRNLAEDGVIPRGSDENKALFGEHDQKRLGEWGEASKEFAENTRGSPVIFPDPNRGPEQFKQTVFYNAELPALSGNQAIRGLSPMSYTCDEAGADQDFGFARAFAPISPAFANDHAFGLNESQLVLVRVGGETAPMSCIPSAEISGPPSSHPKPRPGQVRLKAKASSPRRRSRPGSPPRRKIARPRSRAEASSAEGLAPEQPRAALRRPGLFFLHHLAHDLAEQGDQLRHGRLRRERGVLSHPRFRRGQQASA